jgi:hypothetical protein
MHYDAYIQEIFDEFREFRHYPKAKMKIYALYFTYLLVSLKCAAIAAARPGELA